MSTDGVVLVVRGLHGFLAGEEKRLAVGEALIVGRSRRADLSTRRAPKLKERPDWVRIIGTPGFLTLSRRHARIRHVAPGVAEIVDLSSNGTYLDGRQIVRETVSDLATRSHILAMGAQERFELTLEAAAPAVPAPGADGAPRS
jgi:pSer/pThr/pTyr-binding forkhead associated (FHA) protein